MVNIFELSFNRRIFEQNTMVSSINGLRFCSSQTLSHLLNSFCFIFGQNLEAFVYQNIRSCCRPTSAKCFFWRLVQIPLQVHYCTCCLHGKQSSFLFNNALPDHTLVSPFLDPQSLLISCSSTELYPSLHHVVGIMTYHQNSAPFLYLLLESSTVIANHKKSSSSGSSIHHPPTFHLKLKCHLFKNSNPD